MYYLTSEIHHYTVKAYKWSCKNWLTVAIRPEKTKVSKKERKQKKEDSIIHSFLIVIIDSIDTLEIYFLFPFQVHIRVIYSMDILLFIVILSCEHIILLLIIALSYLVVFTHWIYLYTHYPHWYVIVGLEDWPYCKSIMLLSAPGRVTIRGKS